jgi:hypothetical protein
MATACWAGRLAAMCWPARSKLRVVPRDMGEGLCLLVPRWEGNAWGWFHRAANTSSSWQWRDYRLLHFRSIKPGEPSLWTITFFGHFELLNHRIQIEVQHLLHSICSFSSEQGINHNFSTEWDSNWTKKPWKCSCFHFNCPWLFQNCKHRTSFKKFTVIKTLQFQLN